MAVREGWMAEKTGKERGWGCGKAGALLQALREGNQASAVYAVWQFFCLLLSDSDKSSVLMDLKL